jgi:hypothetical protein
MEQVLRPWTVVARRHRLGLSILLLSSCASVAWGGPPFFTDDPEPVEYKHWEVYLASQYLRTESDRSGTAPQIEVNYGAYPNLQLHVIAPAQFDRPAGGPTAYGYGDTELGAKYRFIQETDDRPMVGIYPLVEAPTGDASRNLGNGKAQVYLPLWLQKSWGSWTTYGGGGYWFNANTDIGNAGFFGWLLQRDLSKALTLGWEVFHRAGLTVDGPAGTGFTGGGQVNFGEYYHLLFSAGRDFSGTQNLTTYLAFQWTF